MIFNMEIGDIRLYKGDCLELMKNIPSKSIDCVICDLPYGVGNTACKWDSMIDLDILLKQYLRIAKDNSPICLFGVEPFSSILRTKMIDYYRHEWYWNKGNAANFIQAKNHPLKIVENIIVFSKNKVNYYPIMECRDESYINEYNKKRNKDVRSQIRSDNFLSDKSLRISERNGTKTYPKNILTFNNRGKECNTRNKVHPTQKPVDLLEYLIKTYSNEGDVILDNTMGSGSTMVACVNTNRKGIGIELDEKYYNIACDRVKKAINEKKQLLF